MAEPAPPRRLHAPAAYDTGSWPDSHWRADHRLPPEPRPALSGAITVEAAVIGGGYAGLNAALELARRHGVEVAVLEAGQPGWGASGRNGGFCCLGGARLDDRAIVAQVGVQGARDFRDFQHEAVEWVAELLDGFAIPARQGPEGEICLAHSPAAFARLIEEARARESLYGESAEAIAPGALAERGLAGPGFHGALMVPKGFGIQPLTYAEGLARQAVRHGALVFGSSPVLSIAPEAGGWRLVTPEGRVTARRVLVATNGYSAETVPDWFAGRLLPVFSAALVTRPLAEDERRAQGFTSPVMSYDSRRLIHYFRHLPDGRFLFGMRGGTSAGPAAEAANLARLRRHFARLFPAWTEIAAERHWSGLLCITRSGAPYLGPVPGAPGLFAAFGWHGNGVAAASLAGRKAAALLAGGGTRIPALMRKPPPRFPLAALRRRVLPLSYAFYALRDGPLP